MWYRGSLLSALLLGAALAGETAAAEPRPLGAVDLLEVPRLSDPQLSPDGTQILYVVSEASWKANRAVGHIHRVNADGSGGRAMTSGTEGESSPRWSPDGRSFAFLAKRPGSEAAQIQLMPNDGGEARPLAVHPTAVRSSSGRRDGASLFFLAAEPKTAEEKAKTEAKDDVAALDEDFKQVHLWRLPLEAKKAERVTSGDFAITAVQPLARRPAHRRPARAQPDVRRQRAGRGLGHGRRRRERRPDHEEHRRRMAPVPLSRQRAGPVRRAWPAPRASPTTAGALSWPRRPAEARARVLAPDFPYAIERAQWAQDARVRPPLREPRPAQRVFLLDVATGGTPKQLTNGQARS